MDKPVKFRKNQLVVTTTSFGGGCGSLTVKKGSVIKITDVQDPSGDHTYVHCHTGAERTWVEKTYIRPLAPGMERMKASKVFEQAKKRGESLRFEDMY